MNRKQLDARLQELGLYSKYYLRRELKLLPQILGEGETLNCILTGVSEGSRKMLAVTDQRLILLSATALAPAEVTVIARRAVTDWSFQKKILFSSLSVMTLDKQLRLTGVQCSTAGIFEWAMKQPFGNGSKPV